MDLAAQSESRIIRIEAAIDRLLPSPGEPSSRLHMAMRYSVQAGGKRLRPLLLLGASELASSPASDPLPAAVAVECLHTYSLIHDDLPCMDNDDLRRGRPTAHKAFDEATALLAGDALLTHAFGLLAEGYSDMPALSHALVRELAEAAGSRRLIAGQMEDLLGENRSSCSPQELEFIHLNKTAAMIEASLAMGGLCAGLGPEELSKLRQAGRQLGLAFQIIDDILDATADTATLGKTAGKDQRAGKVTYVRIHGMDEARRIARDRSDRAIQGFTALSGKGGFLAMLAESLVARTH